MAAVTSSPSKPQSHFLDVPTDEELQRGRKRRRSSVTPPAHLTSNGSTNLRGRGRHRSVSQSQSFTRSSLEDRARSASPERKSPGKKYQKKYQKKLTGLKSRFEKKRRSQSPSRSRSNGGQGKGTPRPRRRQRTRSRTRSHGKKYEESQDTDAGDGETGGKEVSEQAPVD